MRFPLYWLRNEGLTYESLELFLKLPHGMCLFDMEYGILDRDAVQRKKYDLFDELDLDLQHEEHGRAEE